jgi:hypothetical protein
VSWTKLAQFLNMEVVTMPKRKKWRKVRALALLKINNVGSAVLTWMNRRALNVFEARNVSAIAHEAFRKASDCKFACCVGNITCWPHRKMKMTPKKISLMRLDWPGYPTSPATELVFAMHTFRGAAASNIGKNAFVQLKTP